MNFEQALVAVQAFFVSHWNDAAPVAWPAVKFTPPDESWLRFTMDNTDGRQASIGSPNANYHRRDGIIIVQVFGKPSNPQSTGSTEAIALADKVADIFIKQRLKGIKFENVNIKDVGDDGAGWYQYNVTAEYQYDRIT